MSLASGRDTVFFRFLLMIFFMVLNVAHGADDASIRLDEKAGQKVVTADEMLAYFPQFSGLCRAALSWFKGELEDGVMMTVGDVQRAYDIGAQASHMLLPDYFRDKQLFFDASVFPGKDRDQVMAEHDDFIGRIMVRRKSQLHVEKAPHWVGKTVDEYMQKIIELDQEVYDDFARLFTNKKGSGKEVLEWGAALAEQRIRYEAGLWGAEQLSSALRPLYACAGSMHVGNCRMLPQVDVVSTAIAQFKRVIDRKPFCEYMAHWCEPLKRIETGCLNEVGDNVKEIDRQMDRFREGSAETLSKLKFPSIRFRSMSWSDRIDGTRLAKQVAEMSPDQLESLRRELNGFRSVLSRP